MAVDIHSKQNLEDEVYQKDGYVLLNLWAAWCRPCQVMEPTLKFAEEKFKDKISFCRLEVEEQEALADLFQTVGIPTFVLFLLSCLKTGRKSAGSLDIVRRPSSLMK